MGEETHKTAGGHQERVTGLASKVSYSALEWHLVEILLKDCMEPLF